MSRRIKIGFIISNLSQGGAEKQFVELINGLDKDIFDVYVYLYAYQKKAFYDEIFKIENINLEINRLNQSFVAFKILETLIYLNKILRKNNFDVIYTTLFMNGLFVRLVSSRNYNNKVVASMRNSLKSYRPIYICAEKILIRKSFLVFNSKKPKYDFKKIVSSKYHDRLSTIYNGYDFRTDIITPRKKSSNKVVVGLIGRQTRQKNFVQVIRVFDQFPVSRTRLILQGKESDQSIEIDNILENKVIDIEKRKPSPNIDLFFKDVNILVLPSYYEGCPNVLFEAMIRRRICIISEGANSDDFIINGNNGFVYDGSDKGLIKSLKLAFDIIGKKEELRMTEAAYIYAKENFSMKNMIHSYQNLFKKIYEEN